MAENEENIEEEEEIEGEGESGEKKKFPIKILIIAFVVIVFAGGGVFLLKSGLLSGLTGGEDEAVAAKVVKKSGKQELGPIFNMDTFIVNLLDPHGKKYLKVRMDLELDEDQTKMEVEKRMPQFKDTILTMLSSKRFEEVNTMEGKLQLRAEMISLFNQFLMKGMITNIYFTEFIVQ